MAENVIDSIESPVARGGQGILINRNLGLLWFGESISLLGDQFYMVALPWLVLQITGSALAVGSIVAVAGIPRALLMLLGGVFTDRLSPRLLMLASNAVRIVITGILALLVITGTTQLWMLFVLSFAFGIVDAFFHPAYMAILPMIVAEEDLGKANAVTQGTALIVSSIGPGVGGVLVKALGMGSAFVLDTISFVVATFTLTRMDTALTTHTAAKKTGVIAEIREAAAYIAGDELLRTFILVVTALNFLFAGPMMVGPSALVKQFFPEQGVLALGVLLSAMGIGSVVGMGIGGATQPARIGLLSLLSIAMAGLAIAAIGASTLFSVTAICFAIAGLSSGFSNLVLVTWLQKRIDKTMMGRVMSMVMLASFGIIPIGAAVAGLIADHSLTLLFGLNGLLLVGVVGIALLNPRVRGLRA
jgi:MFS family permease